MVKLLKRRSEMINGLTVNNKIDKLSEMGQKLQELKSDSRVLLDVVAQNKSYANGLIGQDKIDFINSYDMTKKFGVEKLHRDLRVGKQSGLNQTSLMINYDTDGLKSFLKNVSVNGSKLDFNERAFDEIELIIRDGKIKAYESYLPNYADDVKSTVDNYSKESLQRNVLDVLHNTKENAVVGLVNNHPLSIVENKLGLRENLEPELRSSVSDKDLMAKFEDIHMNVFGSNSTEHSSSNKDVDLEMGD